MTRTWVCWNSTYPWSYRINWWHSRSNKTSKYCTKNLCEQKKNYHLINFQVKNKTILFLRLYQTHDIFIQATWNAVYKFFLLYKTLILPRFPIFWRQFNWEKVWIFFFFFFFERSFCWVIADIPTLHFYLFHIQTRWKDIRFFLCDL